MAAKINSILFFLILSVGMSSYFLIKPKRISIEEKRKLTTFPSFNWKSYVSGKWTDSMDRYLNDHFPNRLKMIEYATSVRYARGIHLKNQEKIFVYQKRHSKSRMKENQSKDTVPKFMDDFEETYSNSMLILNGSVYPLNSGSPKMGGPFAKMVNEYAERLKGKTRVFSAVSPLSSAFIPAEKYRHYNGKNRATLEAIRDNLSNGAIFCDVFNELNNHASEKLYFSTDHHWTARGAYYAYVAFCKAAGFTPVPKENMERRVKYNFLGTLYERTRDKSVREHADTFEYFVPNVTSTAIRFGQYDYKGVKSNTFCHNCSGGNSYSTFVCGDNPLMKITTSNKNGRKAVVIKNSMGNAFSVYMISHYEEVWVVDFRYSKHNLIDLIEKNGIDDMIFAVGMYAAMSSGTIGMMRNLATQKGGPPPPALPASRRDSSAVLEQKKDVKDTIK
ncbi:MAG: DHHW family protein [Bacteroidota bacterium]|jgi:hypothetical protein